uniref:Uncharacterized protein n=1 Tax=Siphoviridae sp. ctX5W26 TaxID=2825540 RepID=A0A8S5UEP2_9CAUD|nr:MAG TPA: hypothetical protein [Siphoviridae sp. ctX5W26]
MIISKNKKVKASEEVIVEDTVVDNMTDRDVITDEVLVRDTDYIKEAVGHIQSAIDCLGEFTINCTEDCDRLDIVKENIANLAVILADLK